MKRPIRVLLLVLLAVIIAVAAAACGDTGGEEENPQSGTEYTVTFDSNGGSAVAAVKVRDGKKIAAPTAPTKAGYTFGGWCKESGLNNLWNFSFDTVTGNITLYAKWEELPGTEGLTYVFNSGNASYSVTGYTGNTKDIIIPVKYKGLPVTSIADNAFKEKSITSVVIPSGVTSIGREAFYYCYALSGVVFEAGSKLESIGSEAFYHCDILASIEIPAGVTSIGERAFYDCDILASIEIPAGVTSIGSEAFSICYGLVIYARAASQPSGWASDWNPPPCPVYWGINESNYYEDGEGVKYVIVEGSAVLTRAPISAESVTIASSITIGSSVYSVTGIGEYAFRYCNRLASIEIPASVTSIGNSAFYNCASLASIEIPAGVTSIGGYAFAYCTSLVIYARASNEPSGWASYWDYRSCSVYWGINESNYYEDGQGVKYVIEGGSAILTRAPKSVEGITIPNNITIGSSVYSVTSIGTYAFDNCSSLASIEIPEGVKSIGDYAFYYCKALSSVVFGAGSKLGSIGAWAFSRCDSLASIEIPASVTSIGGSAFYGCTSLSSVVFEEGSKLESIGAWAFAYCRSLRSVTINGVTPPELGGSAFFSTPSDMNIYVPSGSEDTYKNASVWSDYSSRITAKA